MTTSLSADQLKKSMPENPHQDKQIATPDNTAVRTTLWRALHVAVDSPPHVFEDEVGIKLVAPEDGWREQPERRSSASSR
jgi:hypothetical protein